MFKIKLLKFLPVIFLIFCPFIANAGEKILPKIKPKIVKELEEKFIQKKALVPVKKPGKKKETKIDKVEKEDLVADIVSEEISIFPQKKPLLYKKVKEKALRKSTILSTKDFAIAKKVFSSIKKGKWQTALKLSQKAKDKSVHKLTLWLYLLREDNSASFYDYINFVNLNSNYPRIGRLRYLAEKRINLNSVGSKRIIRWFENNKPLSGYGKLMYGESLIVDGKVQEGISYIKEGWVTARLSKRNLKFLRKKYKKYLSINDYIKRADWMAWENKYWDLKRMLRYLPKDYQALYNARQLLMSRSYGVDAAIAKVPKKFLDDIGLRYDRLKWRRKRGRLDSSLEIVENLPNDPKLLVRPDKWWKERAIITRSLIYKKKYARAYKISSNHSLNSGPEYAEAEWLSGWIALTFLDDSNLALQHFKNFHSNVGYPISLSRGAYWLGVTYEKLSDLKNSEIWFKESAKYLTTYYGQLSHLKINKDEPFSLPKKIKINKKFTDDFYKNTLVDLVILLKELNKTKYTKDILKHLAALNIEKGSEVLAGNLATSIGRYDFAIQIAKKASYEKRFHNAINYPILKTPLTVNNKRMPAPELILSVIRQESEFDAKANSYVGAKGMMQLMTYTARLVAKQSKLKYSKSKLTSDPNYNIKLGSFYLATLLEQYEGSYPFSLAAYNAGPKRVKYWKKINGNPQKGNIDYVNWIELIKFKETRNYVQRVLENVNVYRYMLAGKPIKIFNFFKDKPHF